MDDDGTTAGGGNPPGGAPAPAAADATEHGFFWGHSFWGGDEAAERDEAQTIHPGDGFWAGTDNNAAGEG